MKMSVKLALAAPTSLLFLLVGLIATYKTEASGLYVFTFSLSAFTLICSLASRPYSAFFTSLGLFLFLGFPLKFFFTAITGSYYIEPVGGFDGSQAQWNEALLVASVAMFGFSLAALADAPVGALKVSLARVGLHPAYIRIERPLALISLIVALAIFFANWYYGFVKVGIDHAVIIPRFAFVTTSFVVLWGAALWLACLAYWAWSGGRLPMWGVLALGMIAGVLAGISNASRARYIFHSLAFLLGWLASARVRSDWWPGSARLLALLVFGVFGLVVSLAAVSMDRVSMYASGAALGLQHEAVEEHSVAAEANTPSGSQMDNSSTAVNTVTEASSEPILGSGEPIVQIDQSQVVSQISRLFIARWIGMEGVMSVVGFDGKGQDLFWDGISEDPAAGNNGIYEAISNSHYEKLPGMTFLTTAGGVAILYYSGSLFVVLLGIFVLSITGVWLERTSLFLTESPFASSVLAVCFANFICQVNQPYVPFVFTLMMVVACFLIYLFRLAVLSFEVRKSA